MKSIVLAVSMLAVAASAGAQQAMDHSHMHDAVVAQVPAAQAPAPQPPAGGQPPAAPGGPADYLFLREIYDLDLAGVQLVTLSACDTERGKVIRGEGVEGFSRALLAAGSASAITTSLSGSSPKPMRIGPEARGVDPAAGACSSIAPSYPDSHAPSCSSVESLSPVHATRRMRREVTT